VSGHPIVAALYDRILGPVEHAGLGEIRTGTLAAASGRTLEIAAGNGHNLGHYPASVDSLVLAEPDPHMYSRLLERVDRVGPCTDGHVIECSVLQEFAEDLPFEPNSFDSVVCTLGLCTIPDPARALAEVRRVLSPDGRFCFVEHVRSAESGTARMQDLITPFWRRAAGGCHPNRDSLALIESAGFRIEALERGTMPKAPRPLSPLISGFAVSPAP
jgi:ubiquinone/menaquinone biosynthesis C-methylase UbiE